MKTRLVFCLLGMAGVLSAAPVFDQLTVFDPVGAIYRQISIDQSIETPGYTLYGLPDVAVDGTLFGYYTTLYSPGNPADITYVLGIATSVPGCVNGTGLCLVFGYRYPGLARGTYHFDQSTGPFPATLYLAPALQQAGYTATFAVGVESVPEPNAFLLASGALLALGAGFGRRFRR